VVEGYGGNLKGERLTEEGVFDPGCVNAFLAATLSRVYVMPGPSLLLLLILCCILLLLMDLSQVM